MQSVIHQRNKFGEKIGEILGETSMITPTSGMLLVHCLKVVVVLYIVY